MRSLAYIAGLMFVFMYAVGAKAAGVEYYGTPMFYSAYMPDQYQCTLDKTAGLGYCGQKNAPEVAVIGMTKKDAPDEAEGVVVDMFNEVVCSSGQCKSYYDQPFGTTLEPGTTYWKVPTGYYIAPGAGGTTAYRHGTGPLAKVFPIRNVKELLEYNDPPMGFQLKDKDTTIRYDVYCNVAAECNYMGRQLPASEMRKYLPVVLTYNCHGPLCYNQDKSVAGLNAKYF